MSYAIQCIQEGVIAHSGYVSELDIYNRIKCDPEILDEAFRELIHRGFISKEHFANKGHKVLSRFIEGTNAIEVDPDIENDTYDESYEITISNKEKIHNHKIKFVLVKEVFVGNKKQSEKHAQKLIVMYQNNQQFLDISYKIRHLIKEGKQCTKDSDH